MRDSSTGLGLARAGAVVDGLGVSPNRMESVREPEVEGIPGKCMRGGSGMRAAPA